MTTFHLVNLFDAALLSVVTFVAYDALRQLRPLRNPIRAICFSFIAVGAFGWIMVDTTGAPVPWWALMLHAGFAMHAVIRFVARSQEHRYALPHKYHH